MKILVVTPGQWGRGDTISEALKNARIEYGDQQMVVAISEDDDVHVDNYGFITASEDKKTLVMDSVNSNPLDAYSPSMLIEYLIARMDDRISVGDNAKNAERVKQALYDVEELMMDLSNDGDHTMHDRFCDREAYTQRYS